MGRLGAGNGEATWSRKKRMEEIGPGGGSEGAENKWIRKCSILGDS